MLNNDIHGNSLIVTQKQQQNSITRDLMQATVSKEIENKMQNYTNSPQYKRFTIS